MKALQAVVGSARNVALPADPASAFAIYSKDVAARTPAVLRDLLEIRPAGSELPLDQVESVASICKRFVASAMSLGSLSPEAHQTITMAMNIIGGRSNTGEGGEDREVYKLHPVESQVAGWSDVELGTGTQRERYGLGGAHCSGCECVGAAAE